MSLRMTVSLAVRELWISFRLLVVLAFYAAAGVVAAAVPFVAASGVAPPAATAAWYAGALAAASGGAAALGAAAFAAERRRGGLGWMAARAVPRSLLLVGWLTALVGVMVAGLLPSATLAWLSVSTEPAFALAGGSPLTFAVAVAAAAADATAWIAVGLLAGTILAPRLAGALTLLLIAALLLLAALTPEAVAWLPVGGVALLAEAGSMASLAAGLQAIGVGLLYAAALMVTGMAALTRRDL